MDRAPLCFVVMPFTPELNFFYLYISKYLQEKHGVMVERGGHRIMTKPLMDKVRDQIQECDLVIGDISHKNPNVFYELGLAYAYGKPIIYLTQDEPANAPVDIRQFEFIQYNLSNHVEFLKKLDNAVQNIFVGRYRSMYEESIGLLKQFNADANTNFAPTSMEEFQARVMRGEQIQDTPSKESVGQYIEFLLPKILMETTDMQIMRKLMKWMSEQTYSV